MERAMQNRFFKHSMASSYKDFTLCHKIALFAQEQVPIRFFVVNSCSQYTSDK
jgi:hypothetical protein